MGKPRFAGLHYFYHGLGGLNGYGDCWDYWNSDTAFGARLLGWRSPLFEHGRHGIHRIALAWLALGTLNFDFGLKFKV